MKWWAIAAVMWFMFCVGLDTDRLATGGTDEIFHTHWVLAMFIVANAILSVMMMTAKWAMRN